MNYEHRLRITGYELRIQWVYKLKNRVQGFATKNKFDYFFVAERHFDFSRVFQRTAKLGNVLVAWAATEFTLISIVALSDTEI